MRTFLIIVMITVWPNLIQGQQLFFLDSLFQIDLSGISTLQLQSQRSEMEKLKCDWGLSAGVNISNNYLDEIDAGLSTRIFAKANLFSKGFSANNKDVEILRYQIKLDSILGSERAYSHNYGIFYDYIIYIFNKEKLHLIDSVLTENYNMLTHLQSLYFNKLADYEDILSVQSLIDQFETLQDAQTTYNDVFSRMGIDTLLPTLVHNDEFYIDFDSLFLSLEKDSSIYEALEIKNEILDTKFAKEKAPSFSLALGYDISRHRPFFGANFSAKISAGKDQYQKTKKLNMHNDHRLEMIQAKKEILNLQYEYRYKEKQERELNMKLQIIDESQRKFRLKREVLSIGESIEEKRLAADKQLVQYELIDLKQQKMLLLLAIKKSIKHLNIGDYINSARSKTKSLKFAGSRFLIVEDISKISSIDAHFLGQNEIKIISSKEAVLLKNLELIYPNQFELRLEMESRINSLIENEGKENFLIAKLQDFKDLELRTINQKEYQITALLK